MPRYASVKKNQYFSGRPTTKFSGMHSLTVITPTVGKPSLDKLINSIDNQDSACRILHLLLWDDVRFESANKPESYNFNNRFSIVMPTGAGRNGAAPGSILRSVGLTAARTEWVTFADDDVWWEAAHISQMGHALVGKNWASTLRRIWSPTGDLLGVDTFESVGDDISRQVPYEMCDNNTMVFRRELGLAAAPLYRETEKYDDDRLMYAFLKSHAGPRGRCEKVGINHICPEALVEFFTSNCTPDKNFI